MQKQGVAEDESNDTAISLSKLGKFHPGTDTLAEFVPERATAQYALHPDKWESTFYSLTNKDSDKLKYYGPKKISIPPGTLVGDMAIANKFYRAKTPEEQEQYAELYKASLQPYPVDVSQYRMPELLIPKQGMAEEYELAGVGVAYELGRRAYKERKTARDNPYSATREARKNDEWAKGLERGKHDANDARHFRSSVREQTVAEGLAQDEAEEDSGWRAEFVNEINYNTFEVKLTNTRSKESANFIVRPVDMVSYGPTLSIETMDVHDLQTGQTESWTNDDPAPEGPIAYAISGLFYDNKELQQKLQNIVDTHDTKGQDMMPGLEKRRSIGQEVDADSYVDSGEKTQAAMAKMKKGVAEKLGDNRPKLGSKRDAGKSVRKWRKSRGLDETDVAEDLTRRGFLRGLGAAAVAGAAGSALAGTNDLEFPSKVQKLHSDMMEKNPRYAKEHEALGIALARGLVGASVENNKRWYQKTAELLQKYGVKVNEGVAEGKPKEKEADYGDDYQDMVARMKKLAGLGPLKTVYDPAKRVYRNIPTAQQPKK